MIRSIGLVVHTGKQIAIDAAETVRDWCGRNDVRCTEIDVWTVAPKTGRLSAAEESARAGKLDLIVTIGGDGTFLRGVRVATFIDTPVLGVDVGRVGFLTEVEVDHLVAALDAVNAGRHHIDARLNLTLQASRPLRIPDDMQALLAYGRGPILPPPQPRSSATNVGIGVSLDIVALNDVVFEKLIRDRQASLSVYVDGRLFASYSADALIIATPTGSTAYSFSAGGPVVSPQLDALIFTPVAPHMIFDRSLIVSVHQQIAVRVLDHSGQVAVSVDGALRGVLDPGDWVIVHGGARRSKLVRMKDTDFLGRVRDRFRLADAAAALADGEAPEIFGPSEPLTPEWLD